MPSHSTLLGGFGSPRSREDRERDTVPARFKRDWSDDVYPGTSSFSRVAPLFVAAIGAFVIVGGAILYGTGQIGGVPLSSTAALESKAPQWEPNPEFTRALGVLATKNVLGWPGAHAAFVKPPAPKANVARKAASPNITQQAPQGDDTTSAPVDQRAPDLPPTPEDQQRRQQAEHDGNDQSTRALPEPAQPDKSPPDGYDNSQNPY